MYRGVNSGADFTGSAGGYRPGWFAAAQFGKDKAFITHIRHGDWYRDYFYAMQRTAGTSVRVAPFTTVLRLALSSAARAGRARRIPAYGGLPQPDAGVHRPGRGSNRLPHAANGEVCPARALELPWP